MDPDRYHRGELRAAALVLSALLTLFLATAPSRGAGASASPPPWRSIRVDVNRASVAELMAVRGVGPRTAAEILRGRPWRDLDELRRVLPGRRLEAARPYLALEPPSPD